MRLSAFNVYVPDYPAPGQTVVYNTFSGGFVSLDAPTLAVLRRADSGTELDEDERALVDADFFDDSVGILVDTRAAEEKAYRAWHEKMRSTTHRLHAIVSVTFACNFDCSYCCQSDVLDGRMMKPPIGADTARWLSARAIEIGAKEINLDFVGGEPLLAIGRIEQIVADVRAQTGLDVTFGLITNGLFLTRELVERWVPMGLRTAQVTLDGDETTHHLTRKSKRDEDTFATIFQNVLDVAGLIAINLNGNYQAETIHGFVPLLDKLQAARFPRGSKVFFSPALSALGAPTDSASGSCSWSGSSPEVMIAFGDEIRRHGFDGGDPTAIGPCAFHIKHHYAIDPEGRLYKCPGFLGKPDWKIGHVTTGLTARYVGHANMNPQRHCGSCSHRPECGGGCVAATWIKSGRQEGVNCEIGFYDKHGADLVKRKYAVLTSETVEQAAALFPPAHLTIAAPPARQAKRQAALRVVAA